MWKMSLVGYWCVLKKKNSEWEHYILKKFEKPHQFVGPLKKQINKQIKKMFPG